MSLKRHPALVLVAACVLLAAGSASAAVVSTGFTGTHNSQGTFVDVTSNADVTITGFQMNIAAEATTVTVYRKAGATTNADTTNPGAWTLHQNVNVTGSGFGSPTNVSITPIDLPGGTTVAFALVVSSNGQLGNGSGAGVTTSANDGTVSILSAFETHNLFDPDNTYEGWPFTGSVIYEPAVPPVPFLDPSGLLLLTIALGIVGALVVSRFNH